MNATAFWPRSGTALLSTADSMLRARPLRSWQDAQKEALRQRLTTLHHGWCAEWLRDEEGAPDTLGLEVVEPDDGMGPATEDTACWAFAPPSRRANPADLTGHSSPVSPDAAVHAIAQRMFAFDAGAAFRTDRASATVALEVAGAAWADWMHRLGKLLEGFSLVRFTSAVDRAGQVHPDPWSGMLCVSWSWCGGVWRLELPHGAVAAILQEEVAAQAEPRAVAAAPKVRLDQALAGQGVALRAMLDGAQLNLGELQSLRIGDIVPLRHALDAPANLTSAEGRHVCHGWLGQSEGRFAIELAASAARSNIQNPNEGNP